MDKLILEFLTGKEEGATIAAIQLAVTQDFGLNHTNTEDFLNDMVEEEELKYFFFDSCIRYAIA